MTRVFVLLLVDFVCLGAANSLSLHPHVGLGFVMKSALCSLPLALVCASMSLIFGKWSLVVCECVVCVDCVPMLRRNDGGRAGGFRSYGFVV